MCAINTVKIMTVIDTTAIADITAITLAVSAVFEGFLKEHCTIFSAKS
jgi:hypothetical protein